MIDAIFDRTSCQAAVSGAYQYDTGQRLRLLGLPSPDELLERDELLSGEAVTVQAQFAYEGDSQTEPRLAAWDDDLQAWLVDIPDDYLTRSETVRVYVEVYYGEGDTGGRTKTMYEGVFKPISRPASFGTVTQEQLDAWAAMETEIELALVSTETATQNAKARAMAADEAAETANAAAKAALEAAQAAQDVLNGVDRAMDFTVRTEALGAGEAATATLEGGELVLGLPSGAQGEKGETGDTGPADITLTFTDGVLEIALK
ncbi:MAG: hypothetical protein ACI4WX_13990 [Aristaeellaceae bacterium]